MNSLVSLQALQAIETDRTARDEKWHNSVLRALPSEVLQPLVLAKLQRAVQERVSLLSTNAVMLPRKASSRLLPHRPA